MLTRNRFHNSLCYLFNKYNFDMSRGLKMIHLKKLFSKKTHLIQKFQAEKDIPGEQITLK